MSPDTDHAVDELKRAGLRFACDPVDQPYLWREAILLDPDGHKVFVYHAGKNPARSSLAPRTRCRHAGLTMPR
jgi:hypothetical protein